MDSIDDAVVSKSTDRSEYQSSCIRDSIMGKKYKMRKAMNEPSKPMPIAPAPNARPMTSRKPQGCSGRYAAYDVVSLANNNSRAEKTHT